MTVGEMTVAMLEGTAKAAHLNLHAQPLSNGADFAADSNYGSACVIGDRLAVAWRGRQIQFDLDRPTALQDLIRFWRRTRPRP